MARRALWRSVPSELLIPVAMAAALDVASVMLPFEHVGAALSLPTALARDILVMCGLLELRRRTSGSTSRVLRVGALLLGANAAISLAMPFAAAVLEQHTMIDRVTMSAFVSAVLVVAFTIAMIAAARAGRSWLAPVAIAASLVWRMAGPIWELLLSQVFDDAALRPYLVITALLAQLALLALYRRLGAAAAAPVSDVGRAERGARRAAWSLRVRGGLTLGYLLAFALLPLAPGAEYRRTLLVAVALLFGAGVLVAVVWQMSGLLAMAGARVAGLTSGELHVAAFGALWEGLLAAGARGAGVGNRGPVPMIIAVLVATVCVLVAANALRTLAASRGDVPLGELITTRVSWTVILLLASAAARWMTTRPGPMLMLALGYPVLQAAAMFVLASVYARVARNMQVVAAVDVF